MRAAITPFDLPQHWLHFKSVGTKGRMILAS